MGASLPSHGSTRTGRRRTYRPMAEINVTPFVDVMLVLLIVFMVTAPLLTVGVPVDLPQTRGQNISEPDEPLVVSIDSDGQIFVQESVVEMGNLVPLLVAVTEANPDVRIFVRGDRSIAYGQIMQVMGSINAAGFARVALVAELPSDGAQ